MFGEEYEITTSCKSIPQDKNSMWMNIPTHCEVRHVVLWYLKVHLLFYASELFSHLNYIIL